MEIMFIMKDGSEKTRYIVCGSDSNTFSKYNIPLISPHKAPNGGIILVMGCGSLRVMNYQLPFLNFSMLELSAGGGIQTLKLLRKYALNLSPLTWLGNALCNQAFFLNAGKT